MFHSEYYRQREKQEALIARKNTPSDFYNGIYTRWTDPVLTRDHAPLHWRYDLDPETNPFFMERLGINAAFNAGAIELDGKFYLVARVEGADRKSFFAVAESESGVDGFRFWDHPVGLPDTCPEETNVYDMRLTKHKEDYDKAIGGRTDEEYREVMAAYEAKHQAWERRTADYREEHPKRAVKGGHGAVEDSMLVFFLRWFLSGSNRWFVTIHIEANTSSIRENVSAPR